MEEEKELVDFVISYSKLGYGKTRVDVLSMVEDTQKKKGRNLDVPITNGWRLRFHEGWPNISLRQGDPFYVACERMTDPTVFEKYLK